MASSWLGPGYPPGVGSQGQEEALEPCCPVLCWAGGAQGRETDWLEVVAAVSCLLQGAPWHSRSESTAGCEAAAPHHWLEVDWSHSGEEEGVGSGPACYLEEGLVTPLPALAGGLGMTGCHSYRTCSST